MIEVFDDFLERDEFERLEKHIVYNASFPWFLNRVLDLAEDDGLNYLGRTTCEDEDNRQFCYLFFRKESYFTIIVQQKIIRDKHDTIKLTK